MAEKTNRRARMTKFLLRTALIELMQEKPFSKITIKEICEKADLNRTTFYLHYSDQQEVLNDIETDIMERSAEFMKTHLSTETPVEVIETFLLYLQKEPTLVRTLLLDGNDNSFQRKFLQFTWDGFKDRLPDFGPPERARYIKVFLMNGSFQILREWIEANFDLPAKEVAQLIYDLCYSIKG